MSALEWTRADRTDGYREGQEIWTSERVEYGVRDGAGRSVGGYASIDKDATSGLFFVSSHATRDGKNFGAIPNRTTAVTLEAAQALGAKKLADAKKRFTKLALKGEGRQWAGAKVTG